ncbi:MAG: GNAT family N-acetyltransferase [Actinomycetota bacterium]|nr:GNAT family N-acetyltransferase [Actinomycetota bacterium]
MLVSALAGSRNHLSASFPSNWADLIDVDFQRRKIEKVLLDHAKGRTWPSVITDGDTGRVIGRVTLNDIVYANRCCCFISYWLAESATGSGHATRAVGQLLAIAFGELRLHRVDAFVQPSNTASLAVLERCAFERIGVAKRHTYVNGDWRDEALLQKLAPWDGPGLTEPAPTLETTAVAEPVTGLSADA